MYTYKIGIAAKEHDDFVKNSSQTNLLQSSSWAKIKDDWGNERVGFYKDKELVATASILIRPLPLGRTMFYIPRGPIMDYFDKDLVQFVMTSLKTVAKQHKAVFIKFDPSIYFQQHLVEQEVKDNESAPQVLQILKDAGCQWGGRTTEIAETIQPRFQANIYAKDFKPEEFPKKVKQLMRIAENKGAIIEFGHLELVEDFAEGSPPAPGSFVRSSTQRRLVVSGSIERKCLAEKGRYRCTDINPTFSPFARRWSIPSRIASVLEPIDTITRSASGAP